MNQLRVKAVKNKKTQKYFIFVEEVRANQVKLINPAGQVLTVPAEIFEAVEDVTVGDFDSAFTADQMKAADKIFKSSSKGTRKTTTRKKKVKKTTSRTGLGATWSSAKLTFYKFKIEPLDPKQTFKINVDGYGDFEISKEDFQSVFSDVILSKDYVREGSFTFPEFPDKAKKYLKEQPA